MKKIIGIISVIVLSLTLFLNTGSQSDDLFALENAKADCPPPPSCFSVCTYHPQFDCILTCEMQYITCYYMVPNGGSWGGGGEGGPNQN